MFKCSDCGKEFDIKPDYCDCGNNIFEEIITQAPQKQTVHIKETIKKTPKYNGSILERLQINVYALIFFSVCIILSILSIMYLGNGMLKDAENNTPEQNTVLQPVKNIPTINKIWDDTTLQIKEEKPQIVQPQVIQPQTIQPKTTQQKVTPTKVQQVIMPKTTPKTQPAKQQAKTQQTYIPPTTAKIASSKQTVQTTIKQVQQVKTVTPQPIVDKVAQQKELSAYKIALRNKIARNINFTEVVGDGNCAVTFKLDGTGNLISRKFSIQSRNTSLNDVVYNAIIKTPSYKTPPEGYKSETLTLTVKMYGGNFEVELK